MKLLNMAKTLLFRLPQAAFYFRHLATGVRMGSLIQHLDQEIAAVLLMADNAGKQFASGTDSESRAAWLSLCKEHHKLLQKLVDERTAIRAKEAPEIPLAHLPGPRLLSLNALLRAPLPPLVDFHQLSQTKTMSQFAIAPSAVTAWTSFADEAAAFTATLDAANAVYPEHTFHGKFVRIYNEEDVRAYTRSHVWDTLERCPSPPPYAEHLFMPASAAVGGLVGRPDWVALGYNAGFDPQLLMAIEAKTIFTMPVPMGSTLPALYATERTRASVEAALHQTFGYMLCNHLRYGAIVTGEVYCILERDDMAVRVADVRRVHNSVQGVTPQTALYYALHKAAASPGQLNVEINTVLVQPASNPVSSLRGARLPVQALEWFVGSVPGVFDREADQHDKEHGADFASKAVWNWEELNIKYWIAQGRTWQVIGGVIGGTPVAVKVADYAHRASVMEEMEHEVEILDHLQEEQGQAVPRKFAQGYIQDSTLYFIAMEHLGETLENAQTDEWPALKESALAALKRVHARGVLHKDVRPANFLRGGRGRVVLVDFACAELSCDESVRHQERAAVQGFSMPMERGPPPSRPSQPVVPSAVK